MRNWPLSSGGGIIVLAICEVTTQWERGNRRGGGFWPSSRPHLMWQVLLPRTYFTMNSAESSREPQKCIVDSANLDNDQPNSSDSI